MAPQLDRRVSVRHRAQHHQRALYRVLPTASAAAAALPTLGWRIGEHTVMGRGPHDADIDPAHVAQVLQGLYYETALAGSLNSLLPTLEVTTADHILFGTDWPAAPEPTVVRNIANLTAKPMAEPGRTPRAAMQQRGHLYGRTLAIAEKWDRTAISQRSG